MLNSTLKKTDWSYCIQCTDKITGKTGCFIYKNSTPFEAHTPVFKDLLELFEFMNSNKLYTSNELSDFSIYIGN